MPTVPDTDQEPLPVTPKQLPLLAAPRMKLELLLLVSKYLPNNVCDRSELSLVALAHMPLPVALLMKQDPLPAESEQKL